MTSHMVVSSLIFLATLALIFTERVQRTIAAVAGAVLMVGAGIGLGFYGEEGAIEAIDFHTLGLLLGMMVLVALLEPTGFFQYLATSAGRRSKGNPVVLLITLGTITTALSLVLDNVTTVVIIAPVAILISEILGMNPVPLLMAMALLSNTGGAGTLIGDPPNILIGSAAGLSFNDFLVNALPVVLVAWLVVLGVLLYLFRADLRANELASEAVARLDPAQALEDPSTARKVLIVLGATIVAFFLQDLLGLTSSFIALAAAAVGLLWTQPDTHDLFSRIEWNVLIFFMALFVSVGGLESAGVLGAIGQALTGAADSDPILLGIGTIWVVAILSAIVDNIPITIALIPVVLGLGESGVNTAPLWWALVFGAGFGGNGTIIGSTANIIVVSLSERTRTPITASTWTRRGLPAMVAACAVTSLLYALMFPLLSR